MLCPLVSTRPWSQNFISPGCHSSMSCTAMHGQGLGHVPGGKLSITRLNQQSERSHCPSTYHSPARAMQIPSAGPSMACSSARLSAAILRLMVLLVLLRMHFAFVILRTKTLVWRKPKPVAVAGCGRLSTGTIKSLNESNKVEKTHSLLKSSLFAILSLSLLPALTKIANWSPGVAFQIALYT